MDHLAAVVLALLDGEGFLMRDETIVQTDLITGAARDDDRVALALECRGGVGVELPGGVRRTPAWASPAIVNEKPAPATATMAALNTDFTG